MSEWATHYDCYYHHPHLQAYYFLMGSSYPVDLYIMKIKPGKFELWKLVPRGTGNRFGNNDFKCLSTHRTLKAAKLTYKLIQPGLTQS